MLREIEKEILENLKAHYHQPKIIRIFDKTKKGNSTSTNSKKKIKN